MQIIDALPVTPIRVGQNHPPLHYYLIVYQKVIFHLILVNSNSKHCHHDGHHAHELDEDVQ